MSVLLAGDVTPVPGALDTLLNSEPDLHVVASVASRDEIIPAVVRSKPDVVVLDLGLHSVGGLSATTSIYDTAPETRILVRTSLGRPGTLRRARNAGVNGIILRDAPAGELAEAIRGVATGRRIDSQLALDEMAWDNDQRPLTRRELDVLRLASDAADTREIARTLYLSVGTVRNCLTAATAKLEARNRVDALRIARTAGWY
ncbi:response regulator transcription factor [Lentzea sp. BCCO 10_0856]|uniref:Response regulator transcription factor n=1 Tax=Lentzea miocenica TaxID=3095431 RepID=A0ABU4TFG3_9PSEU|nr:response regulator transcription factor [Lentzea sp. BCCO 10_0856]MDX8036921.1 response regulator transcription factor [Lentzea sp. BCCO 10_0856]